MSVTRAGWRSFRTIVLALVVLLATAAADAATMADDLDRAIELQRELVVEHPLKGTLWNDLGNLLMIADRKTEAEEAYKRGLELDPELVSARYNLALLYQQTGRLRRSKRELKSLIKHNPEHAWSHYQLGVVLAESGKRSPAIRHYAHALQLDRRLTDPHFNPHVIENSLMPIATLKAFSELPPAEIAPRIYEDRERIVAVMVQSAELLKMAESAAPAKTETETKAEPTLEERAGEETEIEAAEGEEEVEAAPPPRRRRRPRRRPPPKPPGL